MDKLVRSIDAKRQYEKTNPGIEIMRRRYRTKIEIIDTYGRVGHKSDSVLQRAYEANVHDLYISTWKLLAGK